MTTNGQQELDFSANPRQLYGDHTLDEKMVDTSRDALDGIGANMSETKRKVLELLKKHPLGLTGSEVAKELDLSLLSARPPLTMLKRAGLVFDTGNRRESAWGTKEAVITAFKQHASQELINSGQLGRTQEARVEALLEIKHWILAQTCANGWAATPFTNQILDKLDAMVAATNEE